MLARLLRSSFLYGSMFLVGCRSNRSDLIEAELRTKDRLIREMSAELERARSMNSIFEQHVIPFPSGQFVPTTLGSTSSIRRIELVSGTGGADEDGELGDDVLVLYLAPKDEDGHPVKVVGSLAVQTQEITPEGTKVPHLTWDISAAQLRPLWSQNLLSAGFRIKLGLREPLHTEKLRITAQLTTPDGRTFETDKDIRVRPNASQTLPIPQSVPAGPILTKKAASLLPPRAAK